jgi:exopolysaccharide production protein ExoZ
VTGQAKGAILSIQILRALAAWLVVFHHFSEEVRSRFGEFFGQQGNFGVDIFFVISGFIMHHVASTKAQDARAFVVNRLFRVVPAYWFATALMMLCRLSWPREFAYTDWTPDTVLASLLFVPVENPSGIGPFPVLVVGWTLNIEVFFYLLLGACFVFGRRARFVACAAVLLALPLLWQRDWLYGSVFGTRKLYEFVVGIGIGIVHSRAALLRRARPLLSANLEANLASIGVALLAPAAVLLYLDRDGMRALAAALLVVAGLCFERRLTLDNLGVRVLVRMGEMSYSTYLLHVLGIGVFVHYVGAPDGPLEEFVEWISLCALVLAVSHLSLEYIERNRWLGRQREWAAGEGRPRGLEPKRPVALSGALRPAAATVKTPPLNPGSGR